LGAWLRTAVGEKEGKSVLEDREACHLYDRKPGAERGWSALEEAYQKHRLYFFGYFKLVIREERMGGFDSFRGPLDSWGIRYRGSSSQPLKVGEKGGHPFFADMNGPFNCKKKPNCSG